MSSQSLTSPSLLTAPKILNNGEEMGFDRKANDEDFYGTRQNTVFTAFNLDFYTDVQDLSYLQYHLDQDPRSAKYRKLTKELCEVIEDFSLVNFTTLDIQDKESVGNLVKLIDKSNGYIFAGIEASAVEFSRIAVGPVDWDYYRVAAVQEKYMKDDENIDDDD